MRILRRYGERMGYRSGATIYDADDTKKAILAAMQRCKIDEKLLPVKGVAAAISRAIRQNSAELVLMCDNAKIGTSGASFLAFSPEEIDRVVTDIADDRLNGANYKVIVAY